jgi:DNA-binding NtrC family response regulator
MAREDIMHTEMQSILFICSPGKCLYTFDEVLHAKLLSPLLAGTLQDAEPILASAPLALVVCASELIDGSYRDVLKILKREQRNVPVLVVSLMASEHECEEARRLGAADCMPRPLTHDEVQIVTDRAFEVIARTKVTEQDSRRAASSE